MIARWLTKWALTLVAVAGIAAAGRPAFGREPIDGFWVDVDYLLWWTNGSDLPPLLVEELGGVWELAYGDSSFGDGARSGVRVRPGLWLDDRHIWAAEFEYYSLVARSERFTLASEGERILGRPFFNVQTSQIEVREVSRPLGSREGTFSSDIHDHFHSLAVRLRRNLYGCSSCGESCDICPYNGRPNGCPGGPVCARIDLVGGYRYFRLGDALLVEEDRLTTAPGPENGWRTLVTDNFVAQNDFHGGEIGLLGQFHCGPWSLDILPRLAVGNNHQTVQIEGQTSVNTGLVTIITPSGAFAGRTNSGKHIRDSAVVIPQLSLEISHQTTRHLRTFVGYDVLYWGTVMRAAKQYDLMVDTRNFLPTQDPAFSYPRVLNDQSFFWAHGLTMGWEVRF